MADGRIKTVFDAALSVSENFEDGQIQPITLATLLARLNEDHQTFNSKGRHSQTDDAISLDVNVGDSDSCVLSDVSSVSSWQNDAASMDDDLSCGNGGGTTDDSDSDRECYEEDYNEAEKESMLLQRCIESELIKKKYVNGGSFQLSDTVEDCKNRNSFFDEGTIKRTSKEQRYQDEKNVLDKTFDNNSFLRDNGSSYNDLSGVPAAVLLSKNTRLFISETPTSGMDKIESRINSYHHSVRQVVKNKTSCNGAECIDSKKKVSGEGHSPSSVSDETQSAFNGVSTVEVKELEQNLFVEPELNSVNCQQKNHGFVQNGSVNCQSDVKFSDAVSSIKSQGQCGKRLLPDSLFRGSNAVSKMPFLLVDTVNDSLTEVPLSESKKTISPETDNVDAVSVVSDDVGKSVAVSGNGVVMPSVEDGLSSSDLSDAEDSLMNGTIDHCMSALSDLSVQGSAGLGNMYDDALDEVTSETAADADTIELLQFKAAVADCLSRSKLVSPKQSSQAEDREHVMNGTDSIDVSMEKPKSTSTLNISGEVNAQAFPEASVKVDQEVENLTSDCSNTKPLQLPYEAERESFLIEGVLFRARYLGSTQLISEGQPSKAVRMLQAQEAINRIKKVSEQNIGVTVNQPSTLVDLFVSVEKIMVLNTDLQEIMMDHALRTISYIADIGDLLVVMARRGHVSTSSPTSSASSSMLSSAASAVAVQNQTKICCHVFESDEAQLIAQSISQAFQVAYMEFLKANGINDPDLMKEMDYQDVLSQQAIFGEELFLFSNKDMQKEIIVPKLKNEPLGVVIVESGWGSMVPTIVLASMAPGGAAARCSQLNVGDQIMSVNGVSLVGLPLSTCQNYIKAVRSEILVRLMTVSCTPVVEVLVKRPDLKYQLGFSVQNGVICSLLRGGIAERGGVRVGHRIIEINGHSVVAVPHEKIVSMLATSVGEIHMKTMQTSVYRLLTGQDTPHYI